MSISPPGINIEQAQYCAQVPSYPKALSYPKSSLLDDLCQTSVGPNVVNLKQEYQMFPKAQLETVNVNYCSMNQDFSRNNLNLMLDNSGKIALPYAYDPLLFIMLTV